MNNCESVIVVFLDYVQTGFDSGLRSCVNREVGLGSYSLSHYPPPPPSLIRHIVSVDVKYHARRRRDYVDRTSSVWTDDNANMVVNSLVQTRTALVQ